MCGRIRLRTIFLLFVLTSGAFCAAVGRKDARTDTLAEGPGKRTFIVSKLLLIPTLATIGLKFLLLLPVFLSKIALLGVMNFLGSNISLLISAVMGMKNYLTGDNLKWQAAPQFEDHRFADFTYWNPEPLQLGQNFEFLQSGSLGRGDGIYGSASRSKKKNDERHLYKVPENQLKQESLVYDGLNSDANALGKYQCRWVKETGEDPLRNYHTQSDPSLLPTGFTPIAVNASDFSLTHSSYPVNIKNSIVFNDEFMPNDSPNFNDHASTDFDIDNSSIDFSKKFKKEAIAEAFRRNYYKFDNIKTNNEKEPNVRTQSSATQLVLASSDEIQKNNFPTNSKERNYARTVYPLTVVDPSNSNSETPDIVYREKRNFKTGGLLRCKFYEANDVKKSDVKLYHNNKLKSFVFKEKIQAPKRYGVSDRIRISPYLIGKKIISH
ncbi:uncharacterized protein [Prorops nasuta]|uniref:uncharacterized protein n=1 Tax=Prorops nasuta TaxID=863751 RepID=UPI0034CFECD2